ncbi:MAG: OmpA family protein [Polyangiaceae bacterium]|nr:OmpA family protein [Myxococcales bacterium]MCB9584842.1 OmpA family protein [Polyangiaceae bacterium]MCB9607585.1 OmpA family protein [Polyangiaceae bacterium]
MSHRKFIAVAPLALIALGCASDPARKPVAVGPGYTNVVASRDQTPEPEPEPEPLRNTGSLHFSKSVQNLCGISAEADPNFRYDSASLRSQDQPELKQLADCMRDGAMVNYELLLVGHADPRGSEDYNLALGGYRAASVRQFLIEHGVDESRITTSSRGELDADGYSPSTYLEDRRVDLMLPGER